MFGGELTDWEIVTDVLDFFIYLDPSEDIYTGSKGDTELFTICRCTGFYTVRVVNGFTHDNNLIIIIITIIITCSRVQSGFLKSSKPLQMFVLFFFFVLVVFILPTCCLISLYFFFSKQPGKEICWILTKSKNDMEV